MGGWVGLVRGGGCGGIANSILRETRAGSDASASPMAVPPAVQSPLPLREGRRDSEEVCLDDSDPKGRRAG